MSNLFYLEHPSSGAKNTNIAQTSTTTTTTSSPQHEKKKPPTQILNLFPQSRPNKITNHKQNKKSPTQHNTRRGLVSWVNGNLAQMKMKIGDGAQMKMKIGRNPTQMKMTMKIGGNPAAGSVESQKSSSNRAEG